MPRNSRRARSRRSIDCPSSAERFCVRDRLTPAAHHRDRLKRRSRAGRPMRPCGVVTGAPGALACPLLPPGRTSDGFPPSRSRRAGGRSPARAGAGREAGAPVPRHGRRARRGAVPRCARLAMARGARRGRASPRGPPTTPSPTRARRTARAGSSARTPRAGSSLVTPEANTHSVGRRGLIGTPRA
jgi:hypothetical protein